MNAALILAAGSGRRMAGALDDKVLSPLADGPGALQRSLTAFADSGCVEVACVVCRDEAQEAAVRELLWDPAFAKLKIRIAPGGAERQDSVLNGLHALPDSTELVFVHDAARPLLEADTVRELAKLAGEHGAASVARVVTDTIKELVTATEGEIAPLKDLARGNLRAMETPQVFPRAVLLKGYERVRDEDLKVTDDCSAAALEGVHPALYEAPHPNPKLTTAADVEWVEFLLRKGESSGQ